MGNALRTTIIFILSDGGTVLLMPDSTQMKDLTVGGLFQTDYWNYRMFKTICENNKKSVSPGTLGILTNPEHPIFNSFPTEMHTNWQWFPIIKASRPFMLDNTAAAYRPIVQVSICNHPTSPRRRKSQAGISSCFLPHLLWKGRSVS